MKKSPFKTGIIIGLSNFILAMLLFLSADVVFPLLKFPTDLSLVFTYILFFVSFPLPLVLPLIITKLSIGLALSIISYSFGLFLNSLLWGFIGWLFARRKQ